MNTKDTKENFYSEDFTLEEIRTLRTKERLPIEVRTHEFDHLYSVITIDEFLQFLKALEIQTGKTGFNCDLYGTNQQISTNRSIGAYIETKTPSYFRSIGYDVEGKLLEALNNWGYLDRCKNAKSKDYNVWIKECGIILQSFENNLSSQLPEDCPYPRIQVCFKIIQKTPRNQINLFF